MASPPIGCSTDSIIRKSFQENPSQAGENAQSVVIGNTAAIPVTFTQGVPFVEYSDISSLASGTLTTILSYTVPVGKTLAMEKVEVSGCNVADYVVEVDGAIKGKRRTYFGNFNADFDYKGLQVAAGLVVRVRVIHSRPTTGNFDASLIGSLL
jgi:hypothetical protein